MMHVHSGDINNSIFCVLVPGVAHILFPILIITLQSRFKKKMPVIPQNSSVQFTLVTQSCPTLWDPMNRSTPIVTTSLMQTPDWVLDMQFVQSLNRVQLFVTRWTAACQASLSFTISCSLLKLMSIKSVMPSHLCRPLLPLPSIFPSIRVLSSDLALRIKWPKYWRFSFSISPSNEYSGLGSFRIDWLDLLAV